MTKSPSLTSEEQEIVEYIEGGSAKSIPNVNDEIEKYSQIAKEYNSKKKSISIRLSENDLYLLKQKALKVGINYQNIIQSLIHQYTHDRIKVGL